MKMKYLWEDKTMYFGDKSVVFDEKIEDIVEFEDCIAVLTAYSEENPANNLDMLDHDGNRIWKIGDIDDLLASQTIVSVGKKDDLNMSVITFMGVNFLIDVRYRKITEKNITK